LTYLALTPYFKVMGKKTTIFLFICAGAAIFGSVKKNTAGGQKLFVYASITNRSIFHDSTRIESHDNVHYKYFDIVSLTLIIRVTSHSRYPVNYTLIASDFPFYWGTDSKVFHQLGSDVINTAPKAMTIPPGGTITTTVPVINSNLAVPHLVPDDSIKMKNYIDSMYKAAVPGTGFRCWIKIIECDNCAGLQYFPKGNVTAQQDSLYQQPVSIGKFDEKGNFTGRDSVLTAEIVWSNKVVY
jgi:hypothetical protein